MNNTGLSRILAYLALQRAALKAGDKMPKPGAKPWPSPARTKSKRKK